MAILPGEGGPNREINVTPLIDVLLVLLIIFMVITPLTPRGLDALVPQHPTTPDLPQANQTVVVQVLHAADESGVKLKINEEIATWDTIESRLRSIFAERAQRVVFIKGDQDVTFDNVAQVIGLAHDSGIDKVGLMTKQIESGR